MVRIFRASRAVALAAKTGEPLPHIPFLESVYEAGHELYRGSQVMIAGQPGASKSMLALNLAHTLGVPTLYCSADSDAATQLSRLAAIITGVNAKSIRDQLANQTDHAERFTKVLQESNVQFSFDANPDAYDIQAELSAWVELYDEYPQLIVIDNLRNVFSGADNEHGGYKAVQQSLIEVGRDTGACVLQLHHMKEGANRPSTDPAPRSAIDGMVAQLPAQIFSVARDENEFRLCVVKDREADQHPEAQEEHWHRMRIDPTTAQFFHSRSVPARARQIEADVEREWSPTDALAVAGAGW